MRVGTRPVARWVPAWYVSSEIWPSSIETSTCWPRPVRWRGGRAARGAASGEEPGGGAAVDEGRAEGARVVALAGSLELDHAGAEVGEVHRRVRSREDTREVEHQQVVEGQHARQSEVRGERRRPGRARP